MKQARAKQLYTAGFTTLETIANANASDLVNKITHMPIIAAKKIIKSAKVKVWIKFIKLINYIFK